MDRLTSLRVFATAVELGSFAATAEVLGMSGPMVGKHVEALERRLGARLINRTTRRHELTEVGALYYERCKTVLAELDAADMLATESSAPRGTLRVSAPVHLGRHCIAPLLSEAVGQHAGLRLELSFTDRLIDLAGQRIDLAVRTGTLRDEADMMARLVGRQRMIVCASPGYISSRGAPGRIEEISDHQTVVYGRGGRVAPWRFPDFGGGSARAWPVTGKLEFDDLDALADAASHGLGLAWLPSWLVRTRLLSGELVPVLQSEGEYLYDVHVVWPRTPYLPARARIAIDALGRRLPDLLA